MNSSASRSILVTIALLIGGAELLAQDAPGALTDADAAIVAKLAEAQKEFDQRKKEVARTALGRFSSAAMSEAAAFAFYSECQRMLESRMPDVDTSGGKNDRGTPRRTNSDAMESVPGRGAVLQLQLQFLVFTMEAPDMKDRGAMIARMRDFCGKAVALMQTLGAAPEPDRKVVATVKSGSKRQRDDRDLEREAQARRQLIHSALRQGPMDTVFARAYNLKSYFQPPENWPASPLALDSVYSGMLLPFYRAQKPEMLGGIWDEYLSREAVLQRAASDDDGYGRWLASSAKSLQWSKWKDLLVNGRNRAVAADELVKLAKENATHQEVGSWMRELSQLMEQIKTGTLVPPAPAPPPPQP